MTRPRQTIAHLKAELLTAHPDNIRHNLGDLTDLARSIQEHGILQPITVTEHKLGGFLILAGHRRFNAGLRVGLDTFPVIIRHDLEDPAEQLVVMLVENVQRQNLSPVEKAEALGTLRDGGLNPTEISRRTGIHVTTVSSLLNLLELDEASLEQVREGRLNAGDAIAAVREVRQQTRATEGAPTRGRPLFVEPPHFTFNHPLYAYVAATCDHTRRPKLSGSGCCGACWEAVVRADARGEPMPEPAEVDDVVVQRILDGYINVGARPAERVVVVRRWQELGRPLKELERQTGWNSSRYVVPDRQAAAS